MKNRPKLNELLIAFLSSILSGYLAYFFQFENHSYEFLPVICAFLILIPSFYFLIVYCGDNKDFIVKILGVFIIYMSMSICAIVGGLIAHLIYKG
jgi:hypothetical protein